MLQNENFTAIDMQKTRNHISHVQGTRKPDSFHVEIYGILIKSRSDEQKAAWLSLFR